MIDDTALLLLVPSAVRHDAGPITTASLTPAPLSAAVGQSREPPNTVIVPMTTNSKIAPAIQQETGDILAPIFLLTRRTDTSWNPYALASYDRDSLLYLALPGPPVRGDPTTPSRQIAWAADLAVRHREHANQLNNHHCAFHRAYPGLEIEHKFTLQADADIWHLTATTHRLIANGGIRGWICQYGNNGGLEQWDIINHLFAITELPAERGYISFMPPLDRTGGWYIRHKRFASDQTIRRETIHQNVALEPDPDFHRIVCERFNAQPAWHASYRRIYYDIILESLTTGNVFTIIYDRSTIIGEPRHPPLVQAEVEYLRSRTLNTNIQIPLIMSDLNQLVASTRQLLDHEELTYEEDAKSKMTWLSSARHS